MSAERVGTALLVLALLGVGALGWRLQLAPPLQVDASALAALPEQIGAWRGRDIPVEATVESILRADFNLQRVYRHPTGAFVWLYIGYYGTARGGRPEHTPRGCYTGAGWEIESSRPLRVTPDGDLRVTEYRVARGGERRLVHFWYRSHRRTGMVSGLDLNVERVLGRLSEGRADGALVRISTPIRVDETTARARLLAFASELDPVLARHWPSESPPRDEES